MGINYGIEKIRFTNPVPCGSRVRLHARLVSGEEKGGGVLQKIGVHLTQLTQEQADYINVPMDGPYKPNHYRY